MILLDVINEEKGHDEDRNGPQDVQAQAGPGMAEEGAQNQLAIDQADGEEAELLDFLRVV